MVKEIKTEKFEGLAVLAPDDTSGYAMKGKEIIFDIKHGLNKIYQELPFECSVCIGAWPGLLEEQCAEIVESSEYYDTHAQPYPIVCYKGYIDNVWKWDASISFSSLMQSLGCYSENPIPVPEPQENGIDQMDYCQSWVNDYEEAQASTGTWLILKKLIN